MADLINIIPLILTLLVLSRLAGDNPAFRFAQYLFIGVSLGFAFVVVYHQVLAPASLNLLANSADPTLLTLQAVPFVLALLLLPRVIGRQGLSWLANIPLALLFGVGTALALAGVFAGTLLPQLLDTARVGGNEPAQLAGAVLLGLGVIATLCYFYFTLPRSGGTGVVVRGLGRLGRWLLILAFGFFFAGTVLTYLTALNERLSFIVTWIQSIAGI
ncbi:MAG: hypothetical protein MUD01_05285 [Chloroflexaceae bacterium]|jgi:hypothetical protein|nr:hypothetical protein [Chloroflexaceae bacterium]